MYIYFTYKRQNQLEENYQKEKIIFYEKILKLRYLSNKDFN